MMKCNFQFVPVVYINNQNVLVRGLMYKKNTFQNMDDRYPEL